LQRADDATVAAALPESLRNSPTAEALETIVDLDLMMLTDTAPPRSYGRDQTQRSEENLLRLLRGESKRR